MQQRNRKIIFLSLLIALTVLLGYFFKIPTPTGFVTLLDVGIFYAAFSLGSWEGAMVGAMSGFLIDLLAGYPQWMLFSLVIHGLQGYFAGFKGKKRFLALFLASSIMVAGYALVSTFFYGWGAALVEILPNLTQNVLGIILASLLAHFLTLPKE